MTHIVARQVFETVEILDANTGSSEKQRHVTSTLNLVHVNFLYQRAFPTLRPRPSRSLGLYCPAPKRRFDHGAAKSLAALCYLCSMVMSKGAVAKIARGSYLFGISSFLHNAFRDKLFLGLFDPFTAASNRFCSVETIPVQLELGTWYRNGLANCLEPM